MKKINSGSELKILFMSKKQKQMSFENLTMAPIEKDLIIKEKLNESEKNWLNNYHKAVYKNLRKSMNKIEVLELKSSVQPFKILFQSFSNIIFILSSFA